PVVRLVGAPRPRDGPAGRAAGDRRRDAASGLRARAGRRARAAAGGETGLSSALIAPETWGNSGGFKRTPGIAVMRALRVFLPALILLAACSQPVGGHAQPSLPPPTRSVPTSAVGMKQSFAPVVKKAAPAVVNIS